MQTRANRAIKLLLASLQQPLCSLARQLLLRKPLPSRNLQSDRIDQLPRKHKRKFIKEQGMAETFSIGTHVTALWGHRWYAGVVDDILDGGRAYEIAWADEETCNEVPAADVRALAVNEEPRPKQKVQKPRADTKPPQKKRLGASPFVEKPLAPAADESEWSYRARARRPHRRIEMMSTRTTTTVVCCDGFGRSCCQNDVAHVATRNCLGEAAGRGGPSFLGGTTLCGNQQCVGCISRRRQGRPGSVERRCIATPSSRRDGVEDDAMIQHERAVQF